MGKYLEDQRVRSISPSMSLVSLGVAVTEPPKEALPFCGASIPPTQNASLIDLAPPVPAWFVSVGPAATPVAKSDKMAKMKYIQMEPKSHARREQQTTSEISRPSSPNARPHPGHAAKRGSHPDFHSSKGLRMAIGQRGPSHPPL